MQIYRRGSSGSTVKDIQTGINDSGYQPPLTVDGLYGPLTAAGVTWYQKEKGLTVDGIVGSQTMGALGLSSTGNTTAVDPGMTDYTDDSVTRFNGLPGQPELWEVDGQAYMIYYVPDVDPPIPLMFSVPGQEDLDSFFGNKPVKFDKKLTMKEANASGAVPFGSTDTVPEEDGDPWAGFLERMDRAREVQPWLDDPSVFAVVSGAWLEGRAPEQWEFEGTDWWDTQSEAQRSWAWMVMRDPMEAESFTQENYITVYEQFRAMGLDEIDDNLVTYISNQFTQGNWNMQYLEEQVAAMMGDDAAVPLDSGLSKYMLDNGITIDTPTTGISDVQGMFNKWLGPAYPPSDQQVSDWAAKFRRDPQAANDSLEQFLRSQRVALYPEYEDPNLTYEDIASPWRGFSAQVWGQQPDETSDMFQQVVRLNDSVEAGKLLRSEGLKQNIGTVRQSALSGLSQQTGQVRSAL